MNILSMMGPIPLVPKGYKILLQSHHSEYILSQFCHSDSPLVSGSPCLILEPFLRLLHLFPHGHFVSQETRDCHKTLPASPAFLQGTLSLTPSNLPYPPQFSQQF